MLPDQELDDRQLKYFGASLGALLGVFACLAYWRFASVEAAWALVAASIVLTSVYYLIPQTRRSIYQGFRKITYPIQVVMTYVVLGVVYYGLLTPIGWVLRAKGVNLRKKSESESLWRKREVASEPSRYFKTY